MKKCFVRVIHMVSITELIHIICLRRTFFFVSVIVSVDLRTFGGMRNEPSGEAKMVHIVEYYFDDMDNMYSMSVAETAVFTATTTLCDILLFEVMCGHMLSL